MTTTTTEAITTTPKAIFMMGGPGAGKGYIRERRYTGIKVLDCDAFKESHPDYDPKDPNALHKWSAEQVQRAFYASIGAGETFVYDGTGSNSDKYVKMICDAQAAGFVTEVCYVSCPMPVALRRNAERTRTVPESVVREKHATIETSAGIVSKYADNFIRVNNG